MRTLPRVDRLTHFFIEIIHKEYVGARLTTGQYLRQQYTILSSRRAIQRVLNNCVKLKLYKNPTFLIGGLAILTNQLKCFSHDVLEYAHNQLQEFSNYYLKFRNHLAL